MSPGTKILLFFFALSTLSFSLVASAEDGDYEYNYFNAESDQDEENDFFGGGDDFFDDTVREEPDLTRDCVWGGNCYDNSGQAVKTVADLDKTPYVEEEKEEEEEPVVEDYYYDEEEEDEDGDDEEDDGDNVVQNRQMQQPLNEDQPCNEEPEVVIIYQSRPPHGAVIFGVILFVLAVALLFYLPGWYKRRYQPVAVVATTVTPATPGDFQHLELGTGRPSAMAASASVPEMRYESEKVAEKYHEGAS